MINIMNESSSFIEYLNLQIKNPQRIFINGEKVWDKNSGYHNMKVGIYYKKLDKLSFCMFCRLRKNFKEKENFC